MRSVVCFLLAVGVVVVVACSDYYGAPYCGSPLPSSCACPTVDEPCLFRQKPDPYGGDCVDIYCFNGEWLDHGTCPAGWAYPILATYDQPYTYKNCPCGPPVYFGGMFLGTTDCCKQGCPQLSSDAGGDASDGATSDGAAADVGTGADVSVDSAAD